MKKKGNVFALWLCLAILVITAFASISFAQQSSPSSFETFVDDTYKQIQDSSKPFIDASDIAFGTPGAAATSVFSAFNPGYCGEDIYTLSAGWIGLTVLALFVVGLGITLLWMIGQVLQSPNLIATSKEEAYQMFYTVLRVAFIFFVLGVINSWYLGRAGAMGSDPIYSLTNQNLLSPDYGQPLKLIDGAMAFSRSLIVEMITDFSNLVMYNMVLHTIYSATMWFGVTWRAMYSFNMGPVLKPLIDIVGMALQFLSLGIGEWMLHLVLLCLIKRWTWTLFIPVAIFLRTFPPTRGAGEALFAIVFALAVIYPFMFIVTYETHKIMQYNLVDGKNSLRTFVSESGVFKVVGAVVATMFLSAGVMLPFFVGTALNVAFELIRNAVYYVIIMSLLLPFLNIFVTLTAAKEIARFFNVDVSFMSFIKVL